MHGLQWSRRPYRMLLIGNVGVMGAWDVGGSRSKLMCDDLGRVSCGSGSNVRRGCLRV